MPQIIITTNGPGKAAGREVHRERIDPVDVDSDTSSRLLVERIGWALSDADQLERNGESTYEEPASEPFNGHGGGLTDTRVA